jgi:hypothetical protein
MSRWDALKPATTDRHSKPKNQIPSIPSVAVSKNQTSKPASDNCGRANIPWKSKRSEGGRGGGATQVEQSQPSYVSSDNNHHKNQEGILNKPKKVREWNSVLENILQHFAGDACPLRNVKRSEAIQQSLTRLLELLSSSSRDSGDIRNSSSKITWPECGRAIVCLVDQLLLNHILQDNDQSSQALIFQVLIQCLPDTNTSVDDISKHLFLSKQETLRCVMTVSQTCQVATLTQEARRLICHFLARFLRDAATVAHLPAEETAQQIVGKILLPLISQQAPAKEPVMTIPSSSPGESVTGQLRIDVLQAIGTVLDSAKHASSLLAPLVQDVAEDGSEQHVVNPLRQQLFASLQQHLLDSLPGNMSSKSAEVCTSPQLQDCTCQCLIKALNAAHKVKAGNISNDMKKSDTSTSTDIDLIAMENIACRMLLSNKVQDMRLLAFELAQALIKYCPDVSAGLGSTLLAARTPRFQQQHTSRSVPSQEQCCPLCQKREYELPILLTLVHGHPFKTSNDTDKLLVQAKVQLAAIQCLNDLIGTMPLKKWLASSSITTRKSSAVASASGFGRSIVDSLTKVVQITRCLFQRPPAILLPPVELLAQLAKTVLVDIPYQEHQLAHLTNAACELCECLGNLTMAHQRSFILRNETLQGAVFSVLIDSMGGRVTPQGHLTPMSIPTRTWLAGADGSEFFRQTLDSIETMEDSQSTLTNSSQLLRAMLRTRPETAIVHWNQMEQLLRRFVGSEDSKTRLRGLELLEGIVVGRKDFGDAVEEDFTSLVAPLVEFILRRARDDVAASCRCVAFQTYSGLLARDWVFIHGSDEENGILDHVGAIISHCRKTLGSADKPVETDAKVRSAACKAIGDVCTQCISSTLGEATAGNARPTLTENDFRCLFRDVYEAMLEAVEESNVSVRSMVSRATRLNHVVEMFFEFRHCSGLICLSSICYMEALFAMGNLAYSIRCNNLGRLVDDSVLRQVAVSVQRRLLDANDKVGRQQTCGGNDTLRKFFIKCLTCVVTGSW